jgi:hypothetical protein
MQYTRSRIAGRDTARGSRPFSNVDRHSPIEGAGGLEKFGGMLPLGAFFLANHREPSGEVCSGGLECTAISK